jgi:DNA polymerase-1
MAGLDVHTSVSEHFKIPRHIAKMINFSIWYGIGYKKFALLYGLPEVDAKRYIDAYHKNCPGVRRLSRACSSRAENLGYIRLFTGRLRHFAKEDKMYSASNNLIQGTVGEIMRLAMMRIERELPAVRIIMQVHDSVWLEVPKENAVQHLSAARAIMQSVDEIRLPMPVDIKYGPNLSDTKALPRALDGIPAAHLIGCTDKTLGL